MRIVKDAEERKDEILDAAAELFAIKGFEGTSTGDILDKVGIARGTLYYHFKSKEEILDAVISRITSQRLAEAAAIANNREMDILERLASAILALNVDTQLGHEVMNQMHKPQNVLLHHKMQNKILEGIVPILNQLLIEGKEQGLFDTEYTEEAVEMIMVYATIIFDDEHTQTKEQLQRRMQGFIYNTERLMGTQPGQLQQAIMKIFEGNKL